MRQMTWLAVAALCSACGKSQSSEASGGRGGAAASEADASSADAGSSTGGAAAGPTVGAAPGRPSTWKGTYTSTAGTINLPEELKVRWKPEDTSTGLGEGTLSLTVDPARGVVEGTVGGPLGPARVNGSVADGGVSASVVRSDPKDRGYTGVLLGNMTADRLTGTLDLSPATGGAVRVGSFTLTASAGEADR